MAAFTVTWGGCDADADAEGWEDDSAVDEGMALEDEGSSELVTLVSLEDVVLVGIEADSDGEGESVIRGGTSLLVMDPLESPGVVYVGIGASELR